MKHVSKHYSVRSDLDLHRRQNFVMQTLAFNPLPDFANFGLFLFTSQYRYDVINIDKRGCGFLIE